MATKFDGPAPLKGWLPEYSTFVKTNLTPEMKGFPAPSLYPGWHSLKPKGIETFWACVFQATATLESGLDRRSMFKEYGQTSEVTGRVNVSEGLLQLSYGDPDTSDLFLWSQDKPAFLEDYKLFGPHRTCYAKHTERTTLNPYRNLMAGIRTFTRLAKKYGKHPPFSEVFGHYFSTIRDHKIDGTFKKLMKENL